MIAEGELLYYGPRCEAQSYFEELGFEYSREFCGFRLACATC